MKDPADIEEQRKAEAAIDAASIAFEVGLLSIIAERLGSIEGMTYAEIYASMNEDIARIDATMRQGIINIQRTSNAIMDDMAKANDRWADKYYQARGNETPSFFNDIQLNNVLENEKKKAIDSLAVYCRSSVVAVGDKEFVPVEEAYRQTVERAAMAMQAGRESLETAVSDAVKRMAGNGLRVMYQSGNTRNLHTAIRTNVMDSYRTAMSQMREIHGRNFGADGVEVTAHALCAPDHQPFQGQQYSYKEWRDVQFRPARPLVEGANCGHNVFPVILGISSRAYSDKELQDINDRSNEDVRFEGLSGERLTMSRYEASQYQRGIETTIRKQKEAAYLMDKANGDSSGIRKAVKRYEGEYARVSNQTGLTKRWENTKIFV